MTARAEPEMATPTTLFPHDRFELDGRTYEVVGSWRPSGSDYLCLTATWVGSGDPEPYQFCFDLDERLAVVDRAPF